METTTFQQYNKLLFRYFMLKCQYMTTAQKMRISIPDGSLFAVALLV